MTVTAVAVPVAKRTLRDSEEDLARANKRTRAAEVKQAELHRDLAAAATKNDAFEKQDALDKKAANRRGVAIDYANELQWGTGLTMEKDRKGKSDAITGVLACMRCDTGARATSGSCFK